MRTSDTARQLRWHYQWFVLNEFLPALFGETVVDQVLREGPRWFRPVHVVRALLELPVAITGECEIEDYHSLATRDGQGVGLPSAETVARHIGITPLTAEHIGVASTGWDGETPLWYYILREADTFTGGHRLGPVGGRIVAEVLVGLIHADPTSFHQHSQKWRPKKHLVSCWPHNANETGEKTRIRHLTVCEPLSTGHATNGC